MNTDKKKTALYYISDDYTVKCQLCPHMCSIKAGAKGNCKVRYNIEGRLYTSAYSNICAIHLDPVEKKPLFHFKPGTKVLSIAIAGCNFRCAWCQNWEISQKSENFNDLQEITPDEVVQNAIENNSKTIAFTYSEPIIFYEYMLDTAILTKKAGLTTIIISNGFINEDPLRNLAPYIDAANIDLKCFSEETYKKQTTGSLASVLNTLKVLKAEGVWLEITNLIVPGISDNIEMISLMCKWLNDNGFQDTPLHFSRFFPNYNCSHLPSTSTEIMQKACETAVHSGIKFVYLGNMDSSSENTICPACKHILIERDRYLILQNNVKNNSCPSCGQRISGTWI